MSAKPRRLPSPPENPPPDGDGFYGVDDGSLFGVDDGSVYRGPDFAAEEEQG